MTPRPLAILVAAAMAAALATSSPPAHAQGPSARANDAAIAKGNDLAKKKKYADAIAQYERVYGSSQDPRALFAIAKTKATAGDPAGAARAFNEYLKKHAASDPQRQADAMGEVQRLISLVGRVTVRADQEGTSIVVDGEPLATTPTNDALLVNPGSHMVTATKQGFEPKTQAVTVKADESVSLSFELKKDATAAATAPAPPPSEPPKPPPPPAPAPEPVAATPPPAAPPPALPPPATSHQPPAHRAPVFGIAATAALGVGAVVTGVIAVGKVGSFDDAKNTLGVKRSELDDAQSAARTWVFLAGGLALATVVVGTITFVSATSSSHAAPATASLKVAPGSFLLEGSFR